MCLDQLMQGGEDCEGWRGESIVGVGVVFGQQIQVMSEGKLNNPESMETIIPHAVVSTHKVERRQAQVQREQAQQTISYLERQAKKSARDLEMKQKSLIEFLKLKEARFEESRKKDQLKRQRQLQIEEMRRTNSLMRESSVAKRKAVVEERLVFNRKSAIHLKSEISECQKQLSAEKELQRSLLRKKNEALTQAITVANKHSRVKSMFSKKLTSNYVKHDLINVQKRIKSREMEEISKLNSRHQELLDIVQRNNRVKQQYDSTFEEVKTLPFDQMYPRVRVATSRRQLSRSRQGSVRSDSINL